MSHDDEYTMNQLKRQQREVKLNLARQRAREWGRHDRNQLETKKKPTRNRNKAQRKQQEYTTTTTVTSSDEDDEEVLNVKKNVTYKKKKNDDMLQDQLDRIEDTLTEVLRRTAVCEHWIIQQQQQQQRKESLWNVLYLMLLSCIVVFCINYLSDLFEMSSQINSFPHFLHAITTTKAITGE